MMHLLNMLIQAPMFIRSTAISCKKKIKIFNHFNQKSEMNGMDFVYQLVNLFNSFTIRRKLIYNRWIHKLRNVLLKCPSIR